MKSQKRVFDLHTPYHVIVRAIDGKSIFRRSKDIYRFIFQAYVASIGTPVANLDPKKAREAGRKILFGEKIPANLFIENNPPLITRLSFVFCVNHIHELLISNTPDGISRYLQRRNDGFAKYYNFAYKRKGGLFERPPKVVLVKTEKQLTAVFRYINVVNVLDVYQPGWREKGIKNFQSTLEFLENYPFSSLPDFLGKRKSHFLARNEILEKFLGRELIEDKEYLKKAIKDFLRYEVEHFKDLFLE